MKPSSLLLFVATALAVAVPGAGYKSAAAEEVTTIRFATLAPKGSAFSKVMQAMNRSLQKETEGRVQLRFYAGGSQGDERDFVRKMRAGQMDGAALTTVGLGLVARPVMVLSVPGLITEYDQLELVRAKMDERFAKMFQDAGFELLGWGDAGQKRMFSTHEFSRPDDLKSLRPWAWKDDPVFAELVKVIGANPVRLGVPEVYPGLQTRMVDTVPASAIAAVALQWYTRLKYMAKDHFGIIIGAIPVKKEKFDSLSPEDQQALIDTSKRAARALDKIVRRDDATAYRSMLERGLIEVDTSDHRAEWVAVYEETTKNLTGRVYSKSLLDTVRVAMSGS